MQSLSLLHWVLGFGEADYCGTVPQCQVIDVEKLHERLRKELSARGITAAAAARAAGLADSQGIRDALSGRKRVTADLLALLVPLGIDVLYVLTGQSTDGAQTPQSAVSVSDRALLDDFHAAPPGVQAGVKATLAALSPAPRSGRKKAS